MHQVHSACEKFSIRIKVLQSQNSQPGQAGRKAELYQIETGDLDWFRRQTFQVLDWMYSSWKVRWNLA